MAKRFSYIYFFPFLIALGAKCGENGKPFQEFVLLRKQLKKKNNVGEAVYKTCGNWLGSYA